ncbi:hypothetical protein K745_gp31 [Haloarcula hispanica virus PH1]|uniref:Uncharacterized protein n=1 Tax=Haloarcula hispanica virus PH1 TaxID=1282967 RepID=M4JFM2_9VIRU|nr:hypothetical protein K745_gp31 [Haloarcula hispanica virus PH1]AGC65556.1 hypothetical protein HhPH1_gp31 [Haloarcula hispanica virus PH1]
MTCRCISCDSVYCLYREEVHEWWCNDCWSEKNERAGRWPA